MTTPLQIFASIIARATQIADRFLGERRRPHFRQQARTQQLRQFAGIAAVGLDPLARLAGMSAAAMTWQLTRAVVTCRCNA
jgi:hypothetical protein